jgi:cyclophilin family peptidyl-prolyl cis-trans isomerase
MSSECRLLVRQAFTTGPLFHRVVPGFMAQGGDPSGTGEGGSPLADLKAEFNSLPHLRGTVAAARTADSTDTANSQFYIMFVPNVSLNGKYTVLGRVISGMDAVDRIAPGEPPSEPTRIVSRPPRRLMRVDLFDFDLPPDRIALRPARPRDSARLLLVEGEGLSDQRVSRPAGPSAAGRRAGLQRHEGDSRRSSKGAAERRGSE